MAVPQNGVLALGTSSHAYLEFDRVPGVDAAALARGLAGLAVSVRTTGAVGLVVGMRPELWAEVAPGDAPADVHGFDEPVTGPDGFTMPATQHDAVIWVSGGSRSVVFDGSTSAVAGLHGVASLADETVAWSHHHDRDLTGFEDGTENPSAAEAPGVVLVPDGEPGAGGSVLLLQKWRHDADRWYALDRTTQERVIGRTKPDSVELDPKPADAHAARTDQDTYGHIFRRNSAYGDTGDHGTMFVGFCASQGPLAVMLDAMAGHDGPRDALTRYTTALTGAYYVIPAADALVRLAPAAVG
ncbi:Dyp-type peroxidase [Actinomycetospora sp. NBRC 106378]|uniref:Dyp-type peroxidase n=1 Tax=Actinomycetospora sp. NBRC 106378 TaxID=3032208 RepID=UPI0024A3A97D|nr:Dyp-type peroxidase [Actinomycetospora sp. NBRC 106378]GLZ52189.1 deferrochelatase/peroxidase YfeX [Actinomycetospora sp. NBRC 106378]